MFPQLNPSDIENAFVQTTPPEITDVILDFCREIDPSVRPRYIRISPERYCVALECYQNVANKVRREGGKEQQGRTIWQVPNLTLEAEHHAIWISPGGESVDVTPQPDGEERILFLPTSKIKYDGSELIRPIHKKLVDDPLVDEVVAMSERMFAEKSRLFKQDKLLRPAGWKEEIPTVKIGRNDVCPCGSEKKFKKCCGR